MRLDFSRLSHMNKTPTGQVGAAGTAGTASIHARFDVPNESPTVGTHRDLLAGPAGAICFAIENLSPVYPVAENPGGHMEALCRLTVPAVPHVPTKDEQIETETGEIDLVREFMDVDGLTLAEAGALAAISVQPRTPKYWLTLMSELDVLIELYCARTAATTHVRTSLFAASRAQSVVSIPASVAWFRRELAIDGQPND